MSTWEIIGLVYIIGLLILLFWEEIVFPVIVGIILEFFDNVVEELKAAHNSSSVVKAIWWMAYPLVIIAVFIQSVGDLFDKSDV